MGRGGRPAEPHNSGERGAQLVTNFDPIGSIGIHVFHNVTKLGAKPCHNHFPKQERVADTIVGFL